MIRPTRLRTASRSAALATALLATWLAGCASKSGDTPPAPPQPQPQPQIRQQEATPQYRAQLHTELGAGYYERGQMDVAIEELTEAVKLDPNNAKAYNVFGLVYAVLGENQKAEQSFQRALQLAPQDSEVRQNWGWYLCTHGRARESIPEFEAAVRNPLYRTPEVALLNAARCSASYGDVRVAESYFRRTLQVAPNNPAAAYGLAQLSYKSGRYDDARAWMRPVMQQQSPPAEVLYLGLCIERKLGDRQSELSYASQLRNRFPDSPEAKSVATGTCE
jgi:type IV pilus assembly protein PilF